MYVLDTSVLTHLSPTEESPYPALIQWLRRNGPWCYLSAVTLTEAAYSASRLRQKGATAKATELEEWLQTIIRIRRDRILPVDDGVALHAGQLMAIARAEGSVPHIEDAWIAASADLNGMTVLTFNEAGFRPMKIACRNPRLSLPPNVQSDS